LLELLDPEQNYSFLDHYLDVPVDLSKILFICTANVLETIPGPLLDRMEVITLSGYIAEEKREIAKKYLIPSSIKQNGLNCSQIIFKDDSVDALNRYYCRESGVRNLKTQVDKITRKVALQIVENPDIKSVTVEKDNLQDLLGPSIFTSEKLFNEDQLPPGVVTGLAWTSLGGSILYFECLLEKINSESKTKQASFIRTGQLGKVMEESSSLAYSYSRSFLTKNYPENNFFDTYTIHMHVPEGATPKDGPSAGVTMTTALLSLALNKPIPSDLAMTGELSLTGKVMRIGGVREKVVAAKRSGIKRVILPKSNESDWFKLPDYLKEGLEVNFVGDYSEIAKICQFI
jgi:ATP-dependent Lon protease